MSERGLVLALQRIHDDPGFIKMILDEPDNILSLYDLSSTERQSLLEAVLGEDAEAIRQLALQAGLDWAADRIEGPGALPSGSSEQDAGIIGVAVGEDARGSGLVTRKKRVRRRHRDPQFAPTEGHLNYESSCPIPGHGLFNIQP